jgi:hypothetical protein
MSQHNRQPQSIEDAKAAFWAVIAKIYPEITSCDFSPDAQQIFDDACHDAVNRWKETNAKHTSPIDVLVAMGFEHWDNAIVPQVAQAFIESVMECI